MKDFPVGVSPEADNPGEEVICDGFFARVPYRVQTHVHSDHLTHFNMSKGKQDILLSEVTRQFLLHEFNADLPYRQNLKALPLNQTRTFGSSEITFLSSGHMLGAIQVQIHTNSGLSLGYSGDFSWPLDSVVRVDALVLDSTYGSPGSVRQFTQDEAEARFLELVLERKAVGQSTSKHTGVLSTEPSRPFPGTTSARAGLHQALSGNRHLQRQRIRD